MPPLAPKRRIHKADGHWAIEGEDFPFAFESMDEAMAALSANCVCCREGKSAHSSHRVRHELYVRVPGMQGFCRNCGWDETDWVKAAVNWTEDSEERT